MLSLSQEGNEVSAGQNVTKLPTAGLCFFESVIAEFCLKKLVLTFQVLSTHGYQAVAVSVQLRYSMFIQSSVLTSYGVA